jgi:hypothetical protein
MSNSKTAIQEIKSLMKQFGFLKDDEVALASFKLEDNTILQTEKLEVGNKIVKISEEFEQVELENGSYRLVENFEIEVEDGEIKSVKEIFVDAKLVDGTQIKVEGDSLAEGAKVVVVTAEGEVPAPDGVHELEDGTKVETKDGIIAKIEEVVNDVEDGEAPEAPELEVPSIAMEQEMLDMLKEFVKKMSEKMSNMETKMSEVESQFAAFKKEPAAKPIANGKTDFNKSYNNDDALDAKLAAIAGLRNKI